MDDPLALITWPVRTDRLTLRRLQVGDAERVWPWRSLPESYEWVTHPATDWETFRARFESEAGQRTRVLVDFGEHVIGDIVIRVGDGWGQTEVADRARATEAELGWAFDPAYGGRGLATEAVAAVIELCFGPLALRRVTATCFEANHPSWRLMERVGMRREQHGKQDSLHRSGEWLDGLGYALLASEWPRP